MQAGPGARARASASFLWAATALGSGDPLWRRGRKRAMTNGLSLCGGLLSPGPPQQSARACLLTSGHWRAPAAPLGSPRASRRPIPAAAAAAARVPANERPHRGPWNNLLASRAGGAHAAGWSEIRPMPPLLLLLLLQHETRRARTDRQPFKRVFQRARGRKKLALGSPSLAADAVCFARTRTSRPAPPAHWALFPPSAAAAAAARKQSKVSGWLRSRRPASQPACSSLRLPCRARLASHNSYCILSRPPRCAPAIARPAAEARPCDSARPSGCM